MKILRFWGYSLSVFVPATIFLIASASAVAYGANFLPDGSDFFDAPSSQTTPQETMTIDHDMATPSSIYLPSLHQVQDVQYEENFNDRLAQDWIYSDEWYVQRRVFKMNSYDPDAPSLAYYSGIKIADVTLEADVNKVKGVRSWYNGLVFSLSEEGRYLFVITPSGYYCLWRNWPNGTGGFLIYWTRSSAINTGLKQWNRLKAANNNGHISLYINDQYVNSYYDENYLRGGYVGVFSNDEEATKEFSKFDNVSATGAAYPASRFPVDAPYSMGPGFCDPDYMDGAYVHTGMDIMKTVTSNVYSVCDGKVKLNWTKTEKMPRKYPTPFDQYFNAFLIIEHNCEGEKIFGYYGHIHSDLSKNTTVYAGDILGHIRKAYDHSSIRDPDNDHLHFGLNSKYLRRGWGIAPSDTSCKKLQRKGWKDPMLYFDFGW